jgi:hypothetical protein
MQGRQDSNVNLGVLWRSCGRHRRWQSGEDNRLVSKFRLSPSVRVNCTLSTPLWID